MSIGRRAWPLLPACAAYLVALWFTFSARGVPDYDYWDMFTHLVGDDGLDVTLGALYRTSNEHIVALAKLVYLANHALTGGDNFGLSATACTFALVVALIIARMLVATSHSRTESILLGVLAAVAAFTPMAAHNFFIGMSGVAWLGANMLAVLAMAAFMRGHTRNSWPWFAVSFLVAVLAGQFYSTGVVALLAVGLQGIALPRTRRLGAIFLLAGFGYLITIYLLQRVPTGHGSRTFDLGALWNFTTTFIGAGLTRSASSAQVWGTLGILAYAALSVRFTTGRREVPPSGAFWIAVAGFALMNGGIAAIGRSSMGAEAAAMASRYASLPALFWIGLLGLVLCSARIRVPGEAPEASPAARGAVLVALIAAATLVAEAEGRIESQRARAGGKAVAGLALALGVRDEALIRAHVTPATSQIWAAERGLRAIGQVPFDAVPDCPAQGQQLQIAQDPRSESRMEGYLDSAKDVGDGWFRIQGWALDPDSDVPPLVERGWFKDKRGCLVIVDDAGKVLGVGIGGEDRPDVAAHFDRDELAYGWIAFARKPASPPPSPVTIHAALRDSSGRWVRLPNHTEIP